MADDKLVEILTRALCGRHDCEYPDCTTRAIGRRCQTAPEKCDAALAAIEQTHVLVRKPQGGHVVFEGEGKYGNQFDAFDDGKHQGWVAALANIEKTHAIISREATLAEIERMARAAITVFYGDNGRAGNWERLVPEIRAAHAALVKAGG